jgi:hypothetical protein
MISGWRCPTHPARPGAGRMRWDRFHNTANCGNPAEKKAGTGVQRAVPVGPGHPEQALFNDTRHSGRDTHHPQVESGDPARRRRFLGVVHPTRVATVWVCVCEAHETEPHSGRSRKDDLAMVVDGSLNNPHILKM